MSVGEWVAPGNLCEKTQKTLPSHLLETPDLQHLDDAPKILHMHPLHLGPNKKINVYAHVGVKPVFRSKKTLKESLWG